MKNMKNLTSYLLAAALLASPALLVQAAEQQSADDALLGQAAEQQPTQQPTDEQQPTENQPGLDTPTPETTPALPDQEGDEQTEGTSQPNEPTDAMPEQSDTIGGLEFIEEATEQQILVSNLIGYSVTNLQNENIGQVDDLILDQDQRPVGMVISVGGFLGIGAKHVALPISEVQVDRENKIVQVSISKEELNKAPLFKAQKAGQNGEKEGGSGGMGGQ